MKRFIILLTAIILFVVFASYCIKIEKEEKIEVSATVVDMQYEDSYMILTPIIYGKITTFVPRTYPERYLVTISYDDVSETFDDKELYENVKIGDIIQMILYKGYNKKGTLIKQTLQFPE